MSQERKIDFSRWPRQDAAQETGRAVPYLDVTGEDAPIDFLFTLGGEYGLIARANLHTLQGTKKAGKSAAASRCAAAVFSQPARRLSSS